MAQPREIHLGRQKSIARLKTPPASYLMSPLPRYSLWLANAPFLKESSASSEDKSDEEPDRIAEQVARHLHAELLASEGADITREIYKFGSRPQPKRARLWCLEDSRRGLTASLLNVPGGFRRQFVAAHSKHQPSALTRNFVEFLSVYGHFAGEDLEDAEAVACHYEPVRPFGSLELLPLTARPSPGGTATDGKAYFLLLKAFVGTGVLFLPKAFSNGGLVFSIVTLLAFGLLSFWCYLLLVYAKNAVGVSSFADIGMRTYGPWLQRLILGLIILSQTGFVAAYIVFTGENIRAFVANVTGWDTRDIDILWFVLLQGAVLAPLAMIRDITKLSLLALLANIFIFFGLAAILLCTLKEFAEHQMQPGAGIHFWFNKDKVSVFVGVAIFAFEGIGLIIPIQESMIYPNHFPKVLFQVVLTISLIFVFIGSIGYLTFGEAIDTVILLNLPQDSAIVILVQLLYALAILLSTPIQMFPAIRLLELRIFAPFQLGKTSWLVKWEKNLVRCAFVAATSALAYYGGKDLDRLVSFVGCFTCIPLVYMYPPMLHLRTCCEGRRWVAFGDYMLIGLGAAALVYTTVDIILHG